MIFLLNKAKGNEENMKKFLTAAGRIGLITVIIFGMLTLSGCMAERHSIYKYVAESNEALEAFAIKFAAESADLEYDAETTYEDYDVYYWRATGIVEFVSRKVPIMSEAKVSGFYYSPEDIPTCPRVANAILREKEGYGWTWISESGGGWEHTEQIMKKWYWYEADFQVSP